MRKILVGIAALIAVLATLGLASSANAAYTDCTPSDAVPAHKSIEYKYKPVINGSGPTQWSTSRTLTAFNGVAYVRDGDKTRPADVPAVPATVCADSASGDVTWSWNNGDVEGTLAFDASADGGIVSYANDRGEFLTGTVTPGTFVKVGNTATFSGKITTGNVARTIGTIRTDGNDFSVVVTDNGTLGDTVAVFVDEMPYDVHSDVTSGDVIVR